MKKETPMTREPSIDELIQFVRYVQTRQPAALDYFRRNGFVFDNSGGRWEKLAFSLYSDLCELELKVRQMFDEINE
jgi:hypothetical protein